MIEQLYEPVGMVFTNIVFGAGGALLLLKFWGQKWVESNFTKDLEQYKAQMLHEFSILLTRKTKWHEKEHEVLSEAWKKLAIAHASINVAVSVYSKLPDLNKYNDVQLYKFMENNQFTEIEKESMNNISDKSLALSKILDYRKLEEARSTLSDFHKYFNENRIFLSPNIKNKFQAVADHIWSAWLSRRKEIQDKQGVSELDAYEKEKNVIKPLIEDIENTIQIELFPVNSLEENGV